MSHPPHDHGHDGPVADASVRVATVADTAAVGEIQSAVFRAAYASLLPPAVLEAIRPEPFAGAWRESLERPPSQAHRLLVATAGGGVVGFVALGPGQDPDAVDLDAELLVGGVDPSARRAGHGSRLLNAAVDTAAQAGFVRVRAWLPDPDSGTRTFLEAAGFARDGARRTRVVGPSEGDVATELRITVDIPQ